ncbi:hypothetical protein H4R34_002170 [Dimargaris verticillata]|uniref:Secreted protein n=1 Tax=Dimargaris verticillata TaxID=2761393 RepID=A0A9W8B8L6_9FUNG|nr:hypothetical protein H4R34_002170 [Dimargaris verticillata]
MPNKTSFTVWTGLLLATCVFGMGTRPTRRTHSPQSDDLASLLAQLQNPSMQSNTIWGAVPQDLSTPTRSDTAIREFVQQQTEALLKNQSSQVTSIQVNNMLAAVHAAGISHDTTRCLLYLTRFERVGLWCEGAQGPYSSTVNGWEDPKPEPYVVTRAVAFTVPGDSVTAKHTLEELNKAVEAQDQWMRNRDQVIGNQAYKRRYY